MNKKLPKLNRVVSIRFNSLRDQLGSGLGVIPDCDVEVTRDCRRVRTSDGWGWQIANLERLVYWGEWAALQDQECLNNHELDDFEYANPIVAERISRHGRLA